MHRLSDKTNIAGLLASAGLVLGGSFSSAHGVRAQYSLRLDLLVSYPPLLSHLAEMFSTGLDTYTRLLCPADSIPLGVALSLRSGLPLVFSRGSSEPPVTDFVGAYDIGHRALLVMNVFASDEYTSALIGRAKSVGLDIAEVRAIVGTSATSVLAGVPVRSLLSPMDVVQAMA